MILRPVRPASPWPADDELARRVDVEVRMVAEERERLLAVLELDLRQALLHHVLHDLLVHLLHRRGRHLLTRVPRALLRALRRARGRVLRRDHDGVHLERLDRTIRVLLVLNGHLGLQSSVSSLAYPNMMPWSAAPTSSSSLPTC